MADLIDRKALLEELLKELRADHKVVTKEPRDGTLIAIGLESAIDIVKGAPTMPALKAAPVRYARWVHRSSMCDPFCEVWACSSCGAEDENGACYNFCPNCGAKMDGEDKGVCDE